MMTRIMSTTFGPPPGSLLAGSVVRRSGFAIRFTPVVLPPPSAASPAGSLLAGSVVRRSGFAIRFTPGELPTE
jgi:hypothetical protein